MGMKSDTPPPLKAAIFDYGNTLIEFSQTQIRRCDNALGELLKREFGPFDSSLFDQIRHADRMAPYTGEYRENVMEVIAGKLVKQLYDREPTVEQLERMLQTRLEVFVESIETSPEVIALLGRLKKRYKLGLVSNYPCGRAIRASLDRTGIGAYMDVVVVSGDVGHVKPHPRPFEAALSQLNVAANEAIYVGDNWLGDVQGAKRLGMRCAHIVQWDTPEKFDRQPGDHEPDYVLGNLLELERYV
ncbi:MAG: HAD family hydrolase [Phycisphaerales bacterium]